MILDNRLQFTSWNCNAVAVTNDSVIDAVVWDYAANDFFIELLFTVTHIFYSRGQITQQ